MSIFINYFTQTFLGLGTRLDSHKLLVELKVALLRSGPRNITANLGQKGDIYRHIRAEEPVRPVRPWPDHYSFVNFSLRMIDTQNAHAQQ